MIRAGRHLKASGNRQPELTERSLKNILLSRSLNNLILSFTLIACATMIAHSQTTPPKPALPPPAATAKPPLPPQDTLRIEATTRPMPQVVTVVHRLSGIKALALLRRNGEIITRVNDDVVTTPYAVTAITAGFVLGDGQNVVARLPQAEAESLLFSTKMPGFNNPATGTGLPARAAPSATTAATTVSPGALAPPEASSFVIVQTNGQQLTARYVGLDAGSGLSLLRIPGLKATLAKDANEEQLVVGQSVHILAPDRIAHVSNGAAPSTISSRMSATEGTITRIERTSTGKIAGLVIFAPNILSRAIVGGVAVNKAGEVVGIVETIDGIAARLIPVAAVRRAAERLLARQTNVPRPLLGVSGEAVKTTPLGKFYIAGWTAPEATALKDRLDGFFLNSVLPSTPAALANLRPGDVIVRVNDYVVKKDVDFSFALSEAGSGAVTKFTVIRNQHPQFFTGIIPAVPPVSVQTPAPVVTPQTFDFKPFDISIKLGESFDPVGATPAALMKLAEESSRLPLLNPFPPVARGIETAMLSQKAAAHLGARAGMLVLYVDAESLAAKAGLKEFDVIETLEGKLVGQTTFYNALPKGSLSRLTLGVVRDHQRMEITIQQTETPKH